MHPCFGKKYFTNVLPNEILTFPVLLFHLSFSSASDLFFLNSPVYVCLFFLFSYRFPYSPFTHKNRMPACLYTHMSASTRLRTEPALSSPLSPCMFVAPNLTPDLDISFLFYVHWFRIRGPGTGV